MARKKLALVIPAHNEELVLADTILFAVNAGLEPEHIYIVDDHSSDKTFEIAINTLNENNVLRLTKSSGKGLAVTKAVRHFELTKRYHWIHIADADSVFYDRYFKILRRDLRKQYAAATGYIQSLPGGVISRYRQFEYTIGMEIARRVQSFFKVIPVIPGPSSIFRHDVFDKLNFNAHTYTEDFHATLQLYRQQLGDVQYIPKAITYTQDPENLSSYTNQVKRWYRGIFQSVKDHKIGLKAHKIDALLNHQIFSGVIQFAFYTFVLPGLIIFTGRWDILASIFLYDVLFMFILVALAAGKSRRSDLIASFANIYFLRWYTLGIFVKCCLEVIVLKQHRLDSANGRWASPERRKHLSIMAQDIKNAA